jgi:acetyl-CoA acetyltransferase
VTAAYIAGTGMIGFGRFAGETLESLALPAALDALAEADATCDDIDAVYCGNVYGGMLPAQRIAGRLGLTGRPGYNVEAACSSSALALHLAVQAIRARQLDTALVVGVEQLSVFGGGTLRLNAGDPDVAQGVTMPAVYAMRAQSYLAATAATVEDLAAVAVKNRGNGAANPRAQFRETTTVEEVLASRPVAGPLTLLQCCGTGDGAAAAVVSRWPATGGRPLRVAASRFSSGTIGPHDLASEPLTERVARDAYREAAVTAADLGIVETHDAFSIAELLYYEAIGLCGFGEASELLRAGVTERTGSCPVNAGGGLLARGHPLGATGVAQVAETAGRLRGAAADPGAAYPGAADAGAAPTVGLTHCTGGGITGYDHAACAIHILVAE